MAFWHTRERSLFERKGETMKNLLERLLTVILAVGAAVLGLMTTVVPLLVFGYIAYMLFQGRW